MAMTWSEVREAAPLPPPSPPTVLGWNLVPPKVGEKYPAAPHLCPCTAYRNYNSVYATALHCTALHCTWVQVPSRLPGSTRRSLGRSAVRGQLGGEAVEWGAGLAKIQEGSASKYMVWSIPSINKPRRPIENRPFLKPISWATPNMGVL